MAAKKREELQNQKPIWQIAVELGRSVPEADWEKLPKDLAINHDYYLYGVPKAVE